MQFAACAAAWYALGMAKRAVVRKVVKWGGLAASALLAVAWVGSCWYAVAWATPGGGLIGVSAGRIYFFEPLSPLGIGAGGQFISKPSDTTMQWRIGWGYGTGRREEGMPLWIPLLIVTGATAAAWRADARERRRQRVGSCPACGYDRRGLDVGKVCPECGAA